MFFLVLLKNTLSSFFIHGFRTYTNWIKENEITDKKIGELVYLKRLKKNQAENELRAKLKLNLFAQIINKSNGFLDFIRKNENVIKCTVPTNFKQKEIRGHIKDPFNKPYIPGSSIKGAIRTALLYNYLKNTADAKIIAEIIKNELRRVQSNPKEKENIKKKFANQIEQLAFYCGMQKENKEVKYDDEKSDILKLLLVSDGRMTGQENNLGLANVDLYLVSKDKKRNVSLADKQPQAPSLEVIPKNQVIEFDIDFNIDFILSIKDKIKNEDAIIIKEGKNTEIKQWLGIKQKVKTIFNLDIDTINKENKEELNQKIIEHVLTQVYSFSELQQKWDTDVWIKKITDCNEKKFNVEYLKKGFNQFYRKNNLIHIGFGSGFTGITELLYLLDNEELKTLFKEVMETFGIGDNPGADRNRRQGQQYTANPDNFPKSKRLISGDGIIEPIGWMRIISENEVKELSTRKSDKTLTIQTPVITTPKEPYKPAYFTGKLKPGAIVDAELVATEPSNPKIKIFRFFLFEPGKEQEVKLNYFADLPADAFYQVKITNVQKDKVINIQFVKQLK